MLVAKQVVKDKFWILEENGEKLATIQMGENGNVVLVKKNCQREQFPSIKVLKNKYNIEFDNKKNKPAKVSKAEEHMVYGFPTHSKPYNQLLDVSKKLPVFTKSEKSKSFHCAGYYIVKFEPGFVPSFCPKLITLNRYEFKGPFKSKFEMKEQLRLANG